MSRTVEYGGLGLATGSLILCLLFMPAIEVGMQFNRLLESEEAGYWAFGITAAILGIGYILDRAGFVLGFLIKVFVWVFGMGPPLIMALITWNIKWCLFLVEMKEAGWFEPFENTPYY